MAKRFHNENALELPELELTSQSTNYIDLKRCFKKCVNDFTKNHLDEKEDSCSKNCFSKYVQAQIFCTQKMNNEINKLILMDPKLKEALTNEKGKRKLHL